MQLQGDVTQWLHPAHGCKTSVNSQKYGDITTARKTFLCCSYHDTGYWDGEWRVCAKVKQRLLFTGNVHAFATSETQRIKYEIMNAHDFVTKCVTVNRVTSKETKRSPSLKIPKDPMIFA